MELWTLGVRKLGLWKPMLPKGLWKRLAEAACCCSSSDRVLAFSQPSDATVGRNSDSLGGTVTILRVAWGGRALLLMRLWDRLLLC